MPDEAKPQLTLDWLEIRKFRNVEPCRLEFGKGHNVILGINGTGKTQLLELISGLTSGSVGFLLLESFDVDLQFGIAFGAYRAAVAVDVSASTNAPGRELIARTLPRGEAHSIAIRPGMIVGNEPSLLLLDVLLENEPAWGDALSGHAFGQRFDEALGYFDRLTRDDDRARYGPISVTVDASGALRGTGIGFALASNADIIHGWILNAARANVLRMPEAFEARDAVLDQFCELAGYTGTASLPIRATEPSADGGSVRWHLKPDFWFSRGRTRITHDDLSFGEKRLLAFLYYLASTIGQAVPRPSFPIVADELTNGLHRAWVDACFDKMEGRQTFLATQSPLLLDRIGVDSAKDAQTTFVVCRRNGSVDESRLSWKQLTDAEAEAVAAGFKRGVVHMSEILHFENIW